MPLVDYGELAKYLGIEYNDADKEMLEALLTEATKLFEKSCGRDWVPFGVAQTGRVEIHEASPGSSVLTLDYPIATLTSIVAGRDVALPDETILPGDATTVVWRVGLRDLIRVDGGVWRRSSPSWVKVVYNTQDDRPGDAKLAVKRRVAQIYQHRGKEGFTSVTRGSRSWTMAAQSQADEDPLWLSAINNHARGWVR